MPPSPILAVTARGRGWCQGQVALVHGPAPEQFLVLVLDDDDIGLQVPSDRVAWNDHQKTAIGGPSDHTTP